MAIAAPSDEVIRLVEALGLRTKNTREVTLRMAVNEAVAANTVEYVNGEQIGALAAELKERQYRLARWIPVEERLPDIGVSVLCSSPGPPGEDMVWIGQREQYEWYFPGANEMGTPTHWMPLHEPPEVK